MKLSLDLDLKPESAVPNVLNVKAYIMQLIELSPGIEKKLSNAAENGQRNQKINFITKIPFIRRLTGYLWINTKLYLKSKMDAVLFAEDTAARCDNLYMSIIVMILKKLEDYYVLDAI